jgi:spermidine synthase
MLWNCSPVGAGRVNKLVFPERFSSLCVGIFLLCMSTLMFELLLTRIFSVLMWYHFASMAISLALFGLGAAALAVYLRPAWFAAERLWQPGFFALCAGLSTLLLFFVFILFRIDPQFGFRVLSFFHQPFYQPFQQGNVRQSLELGQLLLLALLYLATALPFFFSGLVVTLLFGRHHQHIGRLYFFDLIGAGSGCLLIILVLKLVGGITGLLVVGICFVLSAFFLCPAKSRMQRILPAIALVLLALAVGNQIGRFADIHFVRGRYEPNLLWRSWNSFSRVAVYPAQAEEMGRAWGLSRNYAGPVPEQLGMVVDDTGYTTMYRWQGEETLKFFRQNVINLAYLLRPRAESLIIGPGGGKDVLTALANGARRIVPVEINPLIVEAVNQQFGDFTGELYRQPGVELHIAEGRSYIRRTRDLFDIIQASAVFGRMPPAAGAFTLSENNLYTLEAFQDYWAHLKPEGVLTISRFIFERETLRLVSLGLELLKTEGSADPSAHLAVIKERGLANFMLKKSPFTKAELQNLREIAQKQDYDIVYLPGEARGDKIFKALIASAGSDEFYREFPFDITPTDDNRPFFYYMLKPANFLDLFSFPARSPFEDRAILILRNLLLVTASLVGVVFGLPLLFSRKKAGKGSMALRRAGYFSCLGLGFMMIEIGLLRRFILFLGHPIYSLAIILFSLLIFSGIGSRLSTSKAGDRRFLRWILLALVLLTPLYCYLLPGVLTYFVGLSLLLRCLIAILLLIPLALLLGMPLPLGMALLHADGSAVPWSWGINAAASVLGTILAVILAMNFGFNFTILFGAGIYLIAGFLLPRSHA